MFDQQNQFQLIDLILDCPQVSDLVKQQHILDVYLALLLIRFLFCNRNGVHQGVIIQILTGAFGIRYIWIIKARFLEMSHRHNAIAL